MPGSPDSRPAPDLPPGRRVALVVSTATYSDTSLRQLRAPARDAADLSHVLADPQIGGFAVTSVIDGTAQEVRLAVEEFLSDRALDDLLVVYLSCHGLVDLRRRLYFAATDTLKGRLAATGVEAQWLLDQMEDCRARQQVLILDCCFSGAFAHGAKGDTDLRLGERFHGQGRGRVVLTASRASEYSFEGEPLPGSAMPGSVFTSSLVAGMRSGAADVDNDGYISVDDAYTYAFDHVRATDAEQTPQRWLYGAEGTILLARSPAGITITPAELPTTLRNGLDNPHPAIRLGAVAALGEWLIEDDPARALAARQFLQEIADTDLPHVAAAAQALLGPAQPSSNVAGQDTATGGKEAAKSSRRSSPSVQRTQAIPADLGGEEARVRGPIGFARSKLPRHRRIIYTAGIAAVLAVAGTAAALLIADRNASPPVGGGTWSGEFTAVSPWRLGIVDETDRVNNPGCTVEVTNTDTDESVFRRMGLYGDKSFQMQQTGTFEWEVNDPGCRVFQRSGAGNAVLPFAWPGGLGDTDAFEAQGEIAVEVVDSNSGCDLFLLDATNGQVVAFVRAVTEGDDPALLDPQESTQVYLEEVQCGIQVSAAET